MLDKIAATSIGVIECREPVRIGSNTILRDATSAMTEGNRGAAIIEDEDGRLLGIFTERHLMSALDHGSLDWHGRPVDEIMKQNPKTIMESQSIREALAIMTAGKIRYLPIVDSENRVKGIASIRDILVHVASYFPEEFLNLPPDPDLEATDQWGG